MKNDPEIRFIGYNDAWEQRKLGDEFERVNERNNGQFGITHWISVAKMYYQEPDKVQSNNLDTRTYVMRKGDIAFEGHPNSEFQFGRFVANDIGDGIISELFPIYRHKLPYENSYWKYAIQLERVMRPIYAKAITSSGASSNKLNEEHFLRESILVPQLDEQRAIGAFFISIDNLITLHQRKLDKLYKIKKSMLGKMFPRNGFLYPEIRFEGFKDDWEQRKLGDNIVEYHEVTTENNQYPPLTSSRKGIFLQTEYFSGNQIASADNTGYNIVPYGYFTYRHMSDDEIFYFNINDIVENGIVSTLYPVFTTDENLDSRYLQYQLNYGHEFAKYAVLQKQGGSRTYMYLSKLKQLTLTMPKTVDEQKRISGFFMELDNLITLHQHKLDKLHCIKKSMLEKMFV